MYVYLSRVINKVTSKCKRQKKIVFEEGELREVKEVDSTTARSYRNKNCYHRR